MTQVVEIPGCGSQETYYVIWPVHVNGLEIQGVTQSQGIISHGIDPILPEYFGLNH